MSEGTVADVAELHRNQRESSSDSRAGAGITQSVKDELLDWVLPNQPERNLEVEVGIRFDDRLRRIKGLVDELNESHTNCVSSMCQHGVMRCHVGKRLHHWKEILAGCLSAKQNMSVEDLTVMELLWEKLEKWNLPPAISGIDTLKVSSGIQKVSKSDQDEMYTLHYATVALRAFLAGEADRGRMWAVRGGLNLPNGYVNPERSTFNQATRVSASLVPVDLARKLL